VRYGARHSGYYTSRYEFRGFTGLSGIFGFRKWQPWNPTLKVVLKKKKNPIAMYAYRTNAIKVPIKDEFVGYDLVKHDWVAPYGNGNTSDFLFKLEDTYVSNSDYETILSFQFSNPADGLHLFSTTESGGSNLRSAHNAPDSGYKNKLIQIRTQRPNKRLITSYDDDSNFYFRVHCDGDNPDSCKYGKIYRSVEFDGTNISFDYFINPSMGDTNVEFDPNRNLFGGLTTTLHEVSEP